MSHQLVPLSELPTRWPWATERYVRRLVADRRLPHFKIRNRLWFSPDDLDAHELAKRVEPPTDVPRLKRRTVA